MNGFIATDLTMVHTSFPSPPAPKELTPLLCPVHSRIPHPADHSRHYTWNVDTNHMVFINCDTKRNCQWQFRFVSKLIKTICFNFIRPLWFATVATYSCEFSTSGQMVNLQKWTSNCTCWNPLLLNVLFRITSWRHLNTFLMIPMITEEWLSPTPWFILNFLPKMDPVRVFVRGLGFTIFTAHYHLKPHFFTCIWCWNIIHRTKNRIYDWNFLRNGLNHDSGRIHSCRF